MVLGVAPRPDVIARYVRCDYFSAGQRVFRQAWEAGYRRIGLWNVIRRLDEDRRFEAGLRFAPELTPGGAAIEYFDVSTSQMRDARRLKRNGKRACLVLGHPADPSASPVRKDFLEQTGGGWLDWHANLYAAALPGTCGIDQHDRRQAREAVSLALTGTPQVNRFGKPVSSLHLVYPEWIEGDTLPCPKSPVPCPTSHPSTIERSEIPPQGNSRSVSGLHHSITPLLPR